MAHTSPLILRLIASSVSAATRAGKIVRDVMSRGDLGKAPFIYWLIKVSWVHITFSSSPICDTPHTNCFILSFI